MTIAPEPAPSTPSRAAATASATAAGAKRRPSASPQAELAHLWPAGDDLFTRLGRLQLSRHAHDGAVAPADPLTPWARAFARGDRDALLRRLAWDGIDPQVAAAALADWRAGSGAPGAAQVKLLAAVARAARRSGGRAAGAPPPAPPVTSPEHDDPSSCGPFEELWRPWLAAASALVSKEGPPRGWTAGAWQEHGNLLLRRLEIASRPTVLELLAGERRRDSSPGAARRLCRRLLGSGLAAFYRDAPVLLRRSAGLALDWAAAAAELTARLDADRRALAAAFGDGRNLGELAAVARLGADPHHGGRQVLRLDFTGGVSVAYKPRGVGLESGLEDFLGWMERQGCAVTPRVPRTLARAGYGWQEWVAPEALSGAAEIRGYFRHAGAWLCVAHVLRAQDLHAGNVVATRRGPVVVDCEMFLQPDELRIAPGGPVDAAHQVAPECAESAAGSCLSSGLVTDPLRRSAAWAAAAGGLELPRPGSAPEANVPVCDGVERGPEEYPGEVAAGFAAAYRFLVERRGDLLAADGPLAQLGDRQVRVLFRTSQHYADVLGLLAAPRYQRSGTAPSLLLESLLGIFAGAAERPAVWPLVAAERDALERLDVPRFTAGAADRVLVTPAGERIEGLCAASGCEAVAARLRSLDEADLARQQALLRRALSRIAAGRPVGAGRQSAAVAAAGPGGPAATAGEEALRLGRQLCAELAETAEIPESPEIPEIGAEGQAPASLALGDGACGQALFLAALAAAHRQPLFADAARRALAPVLAWRDGQAPAGIGGLTGIGGTMGIGGMTGIGSLVWTLTWCAELLDDGALRAAALPFARRISVGLAAAPSCDVHDGAAGALLGLLALYDQTRADEVLDLALACGDHLLGVAGRNAVDGQAAAHSAHPGGRDAAESIGGGRGAESIGAGGEKVWPLAGGFGLAGFAHGAAGIARALAALAAASGEERFRAGAATALAAERRLFDSARRNWALLWRGPGGTREVRRLWQVAWCHGAPGAGLARAFVRASETPAHGAAPSRHALAGDSRDPDGVEGDAAAGRLREEGGMDEEMEAAAVTTATAPAVPLDHLCCGRLGRASCLGVMGDLLDRADWRADAVRIAASALAEAGRRGTWMLGADGAGVPGSEWSLLRGLSGIGYQLLALSAPGVRPCALALESPGEVRRRQEGGNR
jgi:lantibiotic modifying enzyme